MKRKTMQDIIDQIKRLDPIPSVTHHLLEVLDDETSTAEEIAEIIQYEPTVTANVIRSCNSIVFGRYEAVSSIKDAVTTLGLDKVVDIVLYQSGRRLFEQADDGYGEHEGVLWKLSVSSAVMTKHIAILIKSPNKNLLFTTALIKDLGKTILGRFVKGSMERINDLVDNKNYTFAQAEKEVIGIDHAEIGSMIAKTWNFPARMAEIIKQHHAAGTSALEDKEMAAVYLADRMCIMMGLSGWVDRNDHKYYNAAMKSLGMDQEDLPALIADFNDEMQDVEDLLRVV